MSTDTADNAYWESARYGVVPWYSSSLAGEASASITQILRSRKYSSNGFKSPGNLAHPRHLPAADVGAVVDPLVVDRVVRRVSNNHQLLACGDESVRELTGHFLRFPWGGRVQPG